MRSKFLDKNEKPIYKLKKFLEKKIQSIKTY